MSPNQRTQLTSGAERGRTPLAADLRCWVALQQMKLTMVQL